MTTLHVHFAGSDILRTESFEKEHCFTSHKLKASSNRIIYSMYHKEGLFVEFTGFKDSKG